MLMEMMGLLLFGPFSLLSLVLACGGFTPGSFREMAKSQGAWHAIVCKFHGALSWVSLSDLLRYIMVGSVVVVVLDFFYRLVYGGGPSAPLFFLVVYCCVFNFISWCMCAAWLYLDCVNGKPMAKALSKLELMGLLSIYSHQSNKDVIVSFLRLKSKSYKFLAVSKASVKVLAFSSEEYNNFVYFLRMRQAELSFSPSLGDDLVNYILDVKSVGVSDGVLQVLGVNSKKAMFSILTEGESSVSNPRKGSDFMSFYLPFMFCCAVGWLALFLATVMVICPAGAQAPLVTWLMSLFVGFFVSSVVWAALGAYFHIMLSSFTIFLDDYKKSGRKSDMKKMLTFLW